MITFYRKKSKPYRSCEWEDFSDLNAAIDYKRNRNGKWWACMVVVNNRWAPVEGKLLFQLEEEYQRKFAKSF